MTCLVIRRLFWLNNESLREPLKVFFAKSSPLWRFMSGDAGHALPLLQCPDIYHPLVYLTLSWPSHPTEPPDITQTLSTSTIRHSWTWCRPKGEETGARSGSVVMLATQVTQTEAALGLGPHSSHWGENNWASATDRTNQWTIRFRSRDTPQFSNETAPQTIRPNRWKNKYINNMISLFHANDQTWWNIQQSIKANNSIPNYIRAFCLIIQ